MFVSIPFFFNRIFKLVLYFKLFFLTSSPSTQTFRLQRVKSRRPFYAEHVISLFRLNLVTFWVLYFLAPLVPILLAGIQKGLGTKHSKKLLNTPKSYLIFGDFLWKSFMEKLFLELTTFSSSF